MLAVRNIMKKISCFFLLLLLSFNTKLDAQGCERVCNSDFENAILATPGNLAFVTNADLDCWNTTAFDGIMEVWSDGFQGVPAYSGQQFIELNANVVSTLYQDISVVPGETFTISFAHRGRWGVDVLSLSIGPIGGPYVNLGNFTADEFAWVFNTINYTFPNNGVTNYSLRFNSVSSSGGMPSVGNFLDAISVSTANVLTVNLAKTDIACTPNLTMGTINASVNGNIGAVTYSWSPNVSTTNAATNLSAGNYQVIVVDSIGCADTAQATILGALPTLSVSSDVAGCIGTIAQFTATGNGTISWSNGISNGVPFTPIVGTTQYVATVTLANGCQLSDTVQTTIFPNPVPVFTSSVQQGCEVLPVSFSNLTPSTLTCLWDFGNGITSSSTNMEDVLFLNDGLYTVSLTVQDQNGCVGTTNLTDYITVFPTPFADFAPSSDFFGFDNNLISFQNKSTDASIFSWSFSADDQEIGTSTLSNPVFDFSGVFTDVSIYLVVSNQFGCTDSTFRELSFKSIETFYVPNTFTPDGNKFNNTFGPVFSSDFSPAFYQLRIFDRWGELLFDTRDVHNQWDGTFHGKSVLDGTYHWEIIYYDVLEKRTELQGHITLMK